MANEAFRKAIADKLAEIKEIVRKEYPTANYYSLAVGIYDEYGYDSANIFVTAPMGDFEGLEDRLEPDKDFEDDALTIHGIRFNIREREGEDDEA